jgi:hypothetical protein
MEAAGVGGTARGLPPVPRPQGSVADAEKDELFKQIGRASIGVEAIALMQRISSLTCLGGLDKAPSRALAPTVARRQSGIDSPDGQSIRPSSSIQSSADLRACSAPNNLSTARMKADSSFSAIFSQDEKAASELNAAVGFRIHEHFSLFKNDDP